MRGLSIGSESLSGSPVTAADGIPLYFAGITHVLGVGDLNVVAALVLVVLITFVLAASESSRREGTIGKLVRRLTVGDSRTGQRV